jgi:holo-[acyl-carrier protein] synthase
VIYGIGADLIELERMAGAVERHGDAFPRRVLGPQEWERYVYRRERSAKRGLAYLATRFAAKEAISKAIGLGMRMPMAWRAVEILNAPSGRPEAVAHGKLAEFLAQKRLRLHITVSDERSMALAYAVAERIEEVV